MFNIKHHEPRLWVAILYSGLLAWFCLEQNKINLGKGCGNADKVWTWSSYPDLNLNRI